VYFAGFGQSSPPGYHFPKCSNLSPLKTWPIDSFSEMMISLVFDA